MANIISGNGKFAQELMLQKLGEIHADVKTTNTLAGETAAEVKVLKQIIGGLSCTSHGERLDCVEDKIKGALGWKSLAGTVIAAVVAGTLLAVKIVPAMAVAG